MGLSRAAIDRSDEVGQQVGNSDRLHPGLGHPTRREHGGQDLDEAAQHLERRRTGTENDRCTQLGDGDGSRGELDSDVVARTQVRRQVVGVVAQSPDVDDVTYPRCFGSEACVASSDLFLLHEVVTHPERMNEVHDLVDAVQRSADRRQVGQVALDDLDVTCPRSTAEPLGGAREAPDDEPGLQQLGHQAPADVSGRAEHQDALWCFHLCILPSIGRLQPLQRREFRPMADRAVHGGRREALADIGSPTPRKEPHMGYGIGGTLVLILVILAIIYFAKRV